MKSRNLFLGIIILFIGIVSLLVSLGLIDFSWRIAWKLWPMFIIFIGISILPVKDWLKALLMITALALSVWIYRVEDHKSKEKLSSGWVGSIRQWWKHLDKNTFNWQ